MASTVLIVGRMRRLLPIIIVTVLIVPGWAWGQATTTEAASKGEVLLVIEPGGAMVAHFPGSATDGGVSLAVTNVLYQWRRWSIFQPRIDATVIGVWGSIKQHGYLVAAPQLVLEMYFGSVFGYEIGLGVGGIAQVGRNTVVGAGMFVSGAYTFRFWQDERRRLKLGMHILAGGYFADDPGNDLGLSAGMISLGIGYESAF